MIFPLVYKYSRNASEKFQNFISSITGDIFILAQLQQGSMPTKRLSQKYKKFRVIWK